MKDYYFHNLFCLVLVITGFINAQELTQIKLSDEVLLEYKMLDSLDEIHMELTCTCTSWCSIGFGDSMVNTDMIRIRKDGTQVIVEDLYSKGHQPPTVDTYQDIVPSIGAITPAEIKGVFRRLLVPLDPSDAKIELGEKIDIIWAISNGSINNVHDSSGVATAIFHDHINKFDCHYKCIFCNGPLAHQCISCKASNEILVNGYCTTNNITKLAVEQKVDKTVTFSWGYLIEDYIDIMVDSQYFGWFALAFGDSLEKTDIVVFQVKTFYDELARIKHKRVEYQDMYSENQSIIPHIDTVMGGTNNIQLVGYEINEDKQRIKVRIRRRLIGEDPYDSEMFKVKTKFMYASDKTDYQMKKYLSTAFKTVELDLSKDHTEKEDTWWKDAVRKSHNVFLFILWGPMTDISIIIIRYFKGMAAHIRIHGLIFVVVNSMTALSCILQIKENYDRISDLDEKENEKELAHFIIGVIILFLIVLQHSVGLALKIGLESARKRFNVNFVRTMHRITGILLYILTKTTLMIGVYLWEDKYYGRYKGEKYWFTIGVSLYYSVLVIYFITMEICYRSEPTFARDKQRYVYQELDEYEEYSKLINDLNSNLTSAEIVQNHPDIIYCILDNKVYDVTHMPHPGGQYILSYIKGRDIGRFFYGGYSLEQFDLSPHTHRMYAKNYLNNKYCGTIDNSSYNPLIKQEDECVEKRYRRPVNVWRLIRDEEEDNQISMTLKKFQFKSEHFKVFNYLSGIQHFGRHFTLKPHGAAMLVDKRQYSMVLCFQDSAIEFRRQILLYFLYKMELNQEQIFENQELEDQYRTLTSQEEEFQFQMPELVSDTLTFMIKKMDQSRVDKGFSHFIHTTQYNLYEIEGPFGQGLEISQTSNGTHFIFAGGTGILPFLDLFDYLLRKCLWTILADRHSEEEADVINPFEEDYTDDLPEDFRIVLFGSFLNVEEFYGYKIIADLYTISEKYNLNILKCMVNFKFGDHNQQATLPFTDQRFDQSFIQQQIQRYGNPAKVYICGSPTMNREVYNDCIRCNIPQSKLLWV